MENNNWCSILVAAQRTFLRVIYAVNYCNCGKCPHGSCSSAFAFFTVHLLLLPSFERLPPPCNTTTKICTMSSEHITAEASYSIILFVWLPNCATYFTRCSNWCFIIVRAPSFLNIKHFKSIFICTGKYQDSVCFKKWPINISNFSFRLS